MTQRKYSRQRELILAEINSRRDHPTADAVYAALREKGSNISLGTVYRNLSLLADEGTVLRLRAAGADRFDADTSKHYHFICTECGRCCDTAPLPESLSAEISRAVEQNINARALRTELTVYGVCAECLKRREQHDNP